MPLPEILGTVAEGAKKAVEVTAKVVKETAKKAGETTADAAGSGGRFNPDSRLREPSFDFRKDTSQKFNPDKRIGPDHLDSIKKLQEKCIKKVELLKSIDSLDSQARGNYGEMKVDRDLDSKGYKRISKDCVKDLETPTGQGIDGVYVHEKTGKTLIVETKFNMSELHDTLDGKQMCQTWIDNRLDAAVGKDKADDIRIKRIENPSSVQSVLARVGKDGVISYSSLDNAANILEGNIKL